MLIVKNKRYIKKHVVGGSGIFDTISSFFKRLVSSNAARSVVSNLSRAAASDIGKKAIGAAKTVGKELATSAISTAKDVAIEKGKQIIDRASSKALTPKNVELINKLTGLNLILQLLSQKGKDILATLINAGANEATTNINKMMMGQGIKNTKGATAIRIQDLVRGMSNGSGLRLA
jgi:hypothetical protein